MRPQVPQVVRHAPAAQVVRGRADHPAVAQQQPDVHPGVRQRRRADREVVPGAADVHRDVRELQLDPQVRVPGGERAEHRGHVRPAEAHRAVHRDPAVQPSGLTPDVVLQVLDPGQHVRGTLGVATALVGQRESAGAAVDQPGAEPALHPGQALADRRDRHPPLPGRLGQRRGGGDPGDEAEIVEFRQVHRRSFRVTKDCPVQSALSWARISSEDRSTAT
ncbi:hypothetical protein AFB00_07675 [Pseudonocardia sp. HH130630-07]|nr:hypothetical protein AFB00_07675 [Pseudonocardia sp. HH130630-07]